MRALLLWLLILALPVYGASSTSLRLLGPAHWHSSSPEAVSTVAEDLLRPVVDVVQRLALRVHDLRLKAHVRAHATGTQHEHHGLQRHWHDAVDGSVHTVGSGDPTVADLVAGASVGSATLALALPPLPMPGFASRANGRWPLASATPWADAEPRHASPPPRC